MFLPRRIILCGLLTFTLLNYVTTDVVVKVPNQCSISFCHNIPYIGGSCKGSSISQPTTCTLDKCEDQVINEEIKNKYFEFVSDQQKGDIFFKKYSFLPFKDTIYLAYGDFVTVPTSLFTMTRLTDIRINESKLRKINFNDFLTLPNLKKINILNNTIIAIETNEESTSNSTVKEIDVSFNFIETVPSKFVSRFSELEHLNMSNNMISSIDKQAFEGTVELKTLDLSHNRLQEVGNIFEQLPKLDSNGAKSPNLQKLTKLLLDDNFIVSINFSELFKTGIPELSIGGNQIPCNELAMVKYYSKLAEKFNRIVTARNLVSPANGDSINGISCQKPKEGGGGIFVTSDYPSSNTIMLISSLKNDLENTKKRIEFLAEGTMVLFESIHAQLRELKKKPIKIDLE